MDRIDASGDGSDAADASPNADEDVTPLDGTAEVAEAAPSITDAGAIDDTMLMIDALPARDAEEACDPPPDFSSDGPCERLSVNAATLSYELWVEDPGSPEGGSRIEWPSLPGQPVTIGGHTFKATFDGLVGGGAHGMYGDALFDVDDHKDGLRFHFEGCVWAIGSQRWNFDAALTRENVLCSGCPPTTIGRRYTVTYTGAPSQGQYTFVAEEPPRSCGAGADLLKFVQSD